MTDHLQSPLFRLELSGQETDAELSTKIRRALREADQATALVVEGSFEGSVTDAEAHGELIGLLLDAPLPVFGFASGAIGPRGLTLLLTADRIVLGPEARIDGHWRASPGVTPLVQHRLGPLLSRSVLFKPSADPLAFLTECGFATRSTDPSGHLRTMLDSLGEGLGRRLKRSLKASSEMPIKEAINFDCWFARRQQGSAP